MKKCLLYFVMLSLIIFNCVGCSSTSKQTAINEVVKSKENDSICNVIIDPKIELLGVVQYIADDHNIIKNGKSYNDDEQKYSQDIQKNFSKYKNEPVVKLYKDMNKKEFSYDTPPNVILHTDDNLKLKKSVSLTEEIISNSGGIEQIQKFLKLLSDFRKNTKFDEFYKAHMNFYKSVVLYTKNKIESSGCIEKLIKYYGYSQNSFNVIIQPLSIGGYAVYIPTKDDKYNVYDLMVVPHSNTSEFCELVIHEFGHSYVNPLTEKYINEVNKYDNLFTPIKQKMSDQAYESWNFCVNEHIVRAVTYRIINDLYGAKISEGWIKYDTSNDFIYLSALSEKLKEYENNRSKYPTFKDFYPKLLDVFKELSEKQAAKQ